jgi:hypothetical protein
MEPFEPRLDAMRPADWIARRNPSLALRALCGGDLVATIAADVECGANQFDSEAALARRFGASRSEVRDALRKLELAGVVRHKKKGRGNAIALA